MITLEEVKKIHEEREDAFIWRQKWSPYALNALEEEYHTIVAAYAVQEDTTPEKVIESLKAE